MRHTQLLNIITMKRSHRASQPGPIKMQLWKECEQIDLRKKSWGRLERQYILIPRVAKMLLVVMHTVRTDDEKGRLLF